MKSDEGSSLLPSTLVSILQSTSKVEQGYVFTAISPVSASVQNYWYPHVPLGKRKQKPAWLKCCIVHSTHSYLLQLNKTWTQSFPYTHKASFVLITSFGTIHLTNLSSYMSGQMLPVKVIISWVQIFLKGFDCPIYLTASWWVHLKKQWGYRSWFSNQWS